MNKWLRLACERVLRLLPCTPGAKKPAIMDWPHEATSDSAKIRRWALQFPGCNWGAAMGAGVLAVDIDAKNGHSGFETLRALEQEHERLPTTLTNLTPHNGEHRIFRVAGQIRNSVGKLGQGLDIRGDGGFILIPPSRIDGTSYRWRDSSAEIARAPEWLLTLIAKPAVDRSSLVPEGKRNDTVFREACRLRSLNIARADARSKLHEFNRVFCVPPLRGS